MITNRRRVVAIAAAFTLVFALGVAWLVRTAMADSTVRASADAGRDTSTPTSSATDSTGPADERTPSTRPTSSAHPSERPSRRPDPPSSPAGGAGENNVPPPPAETIRVSGPLGGGPMDDSCRFFINPFEVTLTIRSIVLASADAGLVREDEHCPAGAFASVAKDLKPCRPGATVAAGAACYAGVQLIPEKRVPPGGGGPFQEYSAQVRLGFTATCVSVNVTPCSQDDVARRAPSATSPVKIEWTPTSDARVVALGKPGESPSASPSASS